MSNQFIPIERDQPLVIPVQEWLTEDHLARAYEAKLAQRRAQEQARGRQLGGRPPKPPELGPQGQDQVNFTDPESCIMPVSGGGFEQAYNAQVGVDHGSRLIVF